jgi:hypothetical protein
MKKAQIHMMESVFVLMFFFIFIGLGLIVFARVSADRFDVKTRQYSSIDAIKVALIAQSAPEFVCTSGTYVRSTCFDMQKLEAFPAMLQVNPLLNTTFYYDQFGYSQITVRSIYPSEDSWVLYRRTKPGPYSSTSFSIPIGIQDSLSRRVHLGVLDVEVYT